MPFCSQCGAKNADEARFCHACGNALPTVPVGPPAAAPPQPQPVQTPPQQQAPAPPQAAPQPTPPQPPPQVGQPPVVGQAAPQYPYQQPGVPAPGWQPAPGTVPMVKPKSPGVAAVLGFLLGGFGAQAFYNGQTKKGLTQLGAFWIIWLFVLPWPQYIGDDGPGALRLLLGLGFGVACAFDGYRIAERRNRGEVVGEFQSF